VDIVEYGRLTLTPASDWSTHWIGKPMPLLTYLGTTLQELVFRASHLTRIGPRLAGLCGGVLAASLTLRCLQICKSVKSLIKLPCCLLLLSCYTLHGHKLSFGHASLWSTFRRFFASLSMTFKVQFIPV
jgi:hypothetical protein